MKEAKSLRCFTIVYSTSRHWGDDQINKESLKKGKWGEEKTQVTGRN